LSVVCTVIMTNAVGRAQPSLLERRRVAFANRPKIDCVLAKGHGQQESGAEAAWSATWSASTTASSVEELEVPRVSEVEDESISPERKRSFSISPTPLDSVSFACNDDRANGFADPGCQRIADEYELLEKLGQGSVGVVYRASSRADSQQVALKVMRMHDQEMLQTARNEYELLKTLDHPKIIKAFEFFTYPMGAVLTLELFDGKSLKQTVREAPRRRLTESKAQVLFSALLHAVAYLHDRDIIHRDIKAENVLVNKDCSDLRLVDFNTARNVMEGALTMTGTADYMPPEVLLGDSPAEGSDIWALGLCLHLMLRGRLPVDRKLFTSREEFGCASQSPLREPLSSQKWSSVSDDCKDVLQRCLEVDPASRAEASDLLASDWVKPIC